MPRRVCILDADPHLRSALTRDLADAGDEVVDLADAELLLVDGDSVGDLGDFLRETRDAHPTVLPIVLLAHPRPSLLAAAGRAGADVLTKPLGGGRLAETLDKAHRRQALLGGGRSRRRRSARTPNAVHGFASADQTMLAALRHATAAAEADAGLLLVGEPGTGKLALARALRRHGPGRNRPYAELLCHRPTTGQPAQDAAAALAKAAGGTLVAAGLDAAPPATLAALTDALCRDARKRNRSAPGTRLVATSAVDTHAMLAAGVPAELLAKLTVTATLPPLRERRGDLDRLCRDLLARHAEAAGRTLVGLTDAARDAVARHRWPGNLRELDAALAHAAAVAGSTRVDAPDLPADVTARPAAPARVPDDDLPLRDALDASERAILRAALDRHDWNRTDTAAALGINRATLFKKIRKHRLDAA